MRCFEIALVVLCTYDMVPGVPESRQISGMVGTEWRAYSVCQTFNDEKAFRIQGTDITNVTVRLGRLRTVLYTEYFVCKCSM